MTRTRARTFVLTVVAVCGGLLAATAAASGPTAPGDALDPRTYAPQSRPFLTVHAAGVQKYTCQANGTWLFTDPEAVLYKAAHNLKPIGTHFLNFTTGRPVWRFKDGSSVEAARTASAPGGTGNIAWLLLQAAGTSAGQDGDRLAATTWVQRLSTSGGVAPAGMCATGDTAAVPYTTDYVFWKEMTANDDD